MPMLDKIKRSKKGRSALGLYLLNHRVNNIKKSLFELGLDKYISSGVLSTFERDRIPDENYIQRLSEIYEIPESKIRELTNESLQA